MKYLSILYGNFNKLAVKNVQNNIKIIKKYTVECTFFAVFYSSNLHLCAMIAEVYCADFA
jgi:hypothetical protein